MAQTITCKQCTAQMGYSEAQRAYFCPRCKTVLSQEELSTNTSAKF